MDNKENTERYERLMERLRVILSHKRELAHENIRLKSQIVEIKQDIVNQQQRLDDITGKVTGRTEVNKITGLPKKPLITPRGVDIPLKSNIPPSRVLTRSTSSLSLTKTVEKPKKSFFSRWK